MLQTQRKQMIGETHWYSERHSFHIVVSTAEHPWKVTQVLSGPGVELSVVLHVEINVYDLLNDNTTMQRNCFHGICPNHLHLVLFIYVCVFV